MKRVYVFFLISIIAIFLISCDKKYTIKINSNCDILYENIVVNEEEKISEPKEPYKEDYIFIEWQVDNKKYNFNLEVRKNFTLSAYFEKISDESIKKAKSLINTDEKKYIMDLAGVIQKYDIDVELLNSFDSDELLEYFMTIENPYKLLDYYINYFYTIIKYDFNNYVIPELSEKCYKDIEQLYLFLDLKNSQEDFSKDDAFLEFILPILVCTFDSYNGNVYTWLIKNMFYQNELNIGFKNFNINRDKDLIVFENKITKNVYKWTFSEIANFYSNLNDSFIKSIRESLKEYIMVLSLKLCKDKLLEKKDDISDNLSLIKEKLHNNKELIENYLQNIKDAYNVYENLSLKLEEDIKQYNKNLSVDDIDNLIDTLNDYKNQIVMVLESAEADNEIITFISDVYELLNAEEYLSSIVNEKQYERIVFIVDNLTSLKQIYTKIISVLKKMDLKDYDFPSIIKYIQDDNDEAATEKINDIIKDIKSKIDFTKYFKVSDLNDIFTFTNLFISYNINDYNRFIDTIVGYKGAFSIIDTNMQKNEILKDLLDDLSKYLSSIVVLGLSDFEINEYNDLIVFYENIKDITKKIDKNIINDKSEYLRSIYEAIFNFDVNLDFSQDVKVIKFNYDAFREYYNIVIYFMITNNMKDSLNIGDNEWYLESLYFIKENFNQELLTTFLNSLKILSINKSNNQSNLISKILILEDNYLDNLDKYIEMLEIGSDLSDHDMQMIKDLCSVFELSY